MKSKCENGIHCLISSKAQMKRATASTLQAIDIFNVTHVGSKIQKCILRYFAVKIYEGYD